MSIKHNLSQLNISFEFYPPKTTEGNKHLKECLLDLARFAPEFYSVTFGAGGSTREGTLKTVQRLQEISHATIAPHVSCLGIKKSEIIALLGEYKRQKINHIVALRGDMPTGSGDLSGDLNFASELVALVRQEFRDYFFIDVAAYPEIHPQAINPHDDILNLKRKCDAGADRAITQYFFNPDAYFYFVDECSRQKIHVPIIPGIMPITQYAGVARFSKMCGADIPSWMRKRFEAMGNNLRDQKAFGLEVVHQLCETLIVGGAPGLHFYTLNKAEATSQILDALGFKSQTQVEERRMRVGS